MAQSALTVTPPNPTPPTNYSFTGSTPPNPPNYSKNLYIDYADNTIINTPANNPFYDDGTAGALQTFATNLAALTQGVGSGATAGGTEGTYPGAANGVVPAATSVAHEGAGTELTVLAPGNITYTYVGGVTLDMSRTASCGPVQTAATIAAGPNATHASSMSPTTATTLTTLTPSTAAAAATGTQGLTVTGTGFVQGCRIWVNNQERSTTFISATSLSTTFPKVGSSAGAVWNVDVKLGGVAVPSTKTFTWT